MARVPRQELTIVPRGARELTLVDQRRSKAKERLRVTWSLRQNAREYGLRLHRIAAVETDRAQEHIQVGHGRRELLPAPQHILCIGEPAHLAVGRAKLLESRRKYRPARCGAL